MSQSAAVSAGPALKSDVNARRARFAAVVAGVWALVFGLGWWLLHFVALPGDNDFHNYVVGALVGLQHGWSQIYNLDFQGEQWTTFTRGAGQLPFIYRAFASPPPVAWLTVPFTLVPIPAGYLVWSTGLFGGFGLTWRILAPGSAPIRFLQLGLSLCLAPVAWELQLGGDVGFVAIAVAGAYWLLNTDRDVLAGCALAALCLKPTVAFLVPAVLLAAQRWRALGTWFAATLAIAAVAVLSLGTAGVAAYLSLLHVESQLSPNWYLSLAQVTGLGTPQVIGSLVVTTAGLAVIARRETDLAGGLAAALFASVAAAPYLHGQDFVMLMPAAWLTWRALPRRWRWSVIALLPAAELVFVYSSLPLLAVSLGLLGLLGLLPRSREDVPGVDQALLPRAREVDADARPAGAA